MKVIKILGTGCPSCISTEKVVAEVVKELNIEAKIVKVTDIQEIMLYDVMSTPAILLDAKVVFKGRVPSKEEVKELLMAENPSSLPEDGGCCSDGNATGCC